MIEDEVMVLLIFADDCLDVKVNILGKCTITTNKHICTNKQFHKMVMAKMEAIINEKIVVLKIDRLSKNEYMLYYKRLGKK